MREPVTKWLWGEPRGLTWVAGVRDLLRQVKVGRDFYIGETG